MTDVIELGDRAKDRITGFTGIVNCVSVWMNGCVRMGLLPEQVSKDGTIPADAYFDVEQLLLVKKGVHKPVTPRTAIRAATATVSTGGGPSREGRGFAR